MTRLHLLRSLGIIAHVDAGKTTLTERILFHTGRIHRVGSVDGGDTTTDSDPLEQKHGITIRAAAVTTSWRGHRLQLIDTPGHVDFGLEVERSLRVLDGAVVVLDGARGVEPQTETVWRKADALGVPRLVFVNKLDRPGASFPAALRSVHERLGVTALPIALPWHDERGALCGVLDVVRGVACSFEGVRGREVREHPVPEALAASVAQAREQLVDACASISDPFLEEAAAGEPSAASLTKALREGTLLRAFVPVLCGSAHAEIGVQPLLDAVVDLLPSPADRPLPIDGRTGAAIAGTHLVAFAFKTSVDDHGTRTFVRVFTGALRRGATVWLGRAEERVRIGRLVRLFGGSVEDVEVAEAGEVCAVVGGKIASFETLSDPDHPVVLSGLSPPEPAVRVAIEPRERSGREKLGPALAALTTEDPSLRIASDPETGQTILAGLGELHVDIAIEALRERFGVEVRAGAPKVSYRETISASAEIEHRHIKQSGGPGQYAVVRLSVRPGAPGTGVVVLDEVRGGEIPRAFVPAAILGVRRATLAGPLTKSLVVDVEVTLLGGAFHANDSSDLAFSIAGHEAMRRALLAAGPVLLEPVGALTVRCPAASVGALSGEIAQRRGHLTSLSEENGEHVIAAQAPLAELFGWTGRMRSLSAGRASSTFVLSGHERVPASAMARAIERAA